MAAPNLITVDPDLVEKMASAISCQKPEVIMHHFGIGVNTWVKLRKGKAIRHSVAQRLLERLRRDQLI